MTNQHRRLKTSRKILKQSLVYILTSQIKEELQLEAGSKPDEGELKILKALEHEKPNSKMSFFHSLLPHLDRFDGNELLQFQMGVLQVISNINDQRKIITQVLPAFPRTIPTHYHLQQFSPRPGQSTPSFTQYSSTNKQGAQLARQYYQYYQYYGASSGMNSPALTDTRDSFTPLSNNCTVDSIDFTSQ